MKELRFRLNGEEVQLHVRGDETLLDVLRNEVGLTGSKAGCKNGDCGACTVHLQGVAVKSCLIFAIEVEGQEVTTVKGLDHPIQQAFIDKQGYQCGFCTSGYLMNAAALIREHPEADEEIDKEWMDSNLCRCTGYDGIKNALAEARAKIKEEA